MYIMQGVSRKRQVVEQNGPKCGHLSQNVIYLEKKKAGGRVKRGEIFDSWILVTHIRGTFDLVGFNVILGSFGALVSKWPVLQNGWS